MDTGVVLFAN